MEHLKDGRPIRVGDKFLNGTSVLTVLDDVDNGRDTHGMGCAWRCVRNGGPYTSRFLLLNETVTRIEPTIEERRAALKPGDEITEFDLLDVGMRVRWMYSMDIPDNHVTLLARGDNGFHGRWDDGRENAGDTGWSRGNFPTYPMIFLGWAKVPESVVEAPTWSPLVAPIKQVVLPFKYFEDCPAVMNHGNSMCLMCESIIAKKTAAESTTKPEMEPVRPYCTNQSTVGPILSKLR